MNLNIKKGTNSDIEECIKEVMDSELGRRAFKEEEVARKVISNGIAAEEIYIARNSRNDFIGVIRSAPKGMFNGFPYLHLIAVAKKFRGQGHGSRLLDYFEEMGLKNTDKIFLLVSDFNTRAKNLYEKKGYKQVGFIEDMFNEGIGEYIMMKRVVKNNN